jgi:hypothetical protein
MRNVYTFEEFLNEGVRFDRRSLIDKLKQKLVIADKAIEKWGSSYEKQKANIEAAIKSGRVDSNSGVGGIQGGDRQEDFEIFNGRNAMDLASEISSVIKKFKKHEVGTSSVGAAAGWSGSMQSTVSGFIRGVCNNSSAGGYYGHDRNFVIAVQIGGGIEGAIRKELIDELYPLFYMFDEYNGYDGGVSIDVKYGTNYDTIGLTCSKFSFNGGIATKLTEIMNGK